MNTGEFEEFDKKQALKHDYNGVTYYSWLYTRFNPKTRVRTKFLCFLVNSKMLYRDYFRGITNLTIEKIYHNLMAIGHFEFSFEQFMKCYVYDIDFACDYYCDYDSKMWFYKKYTYTNLYKVIPFIRHDILQTLQFQKRDTATNSAPYAKFYSKLHECLSASRKDTKEFYKINNLPIKDLNELYRFEYTMKNNKMLNRYHNIENTLENILNIADFQHQKVAESIHLIYTDGYRSEIKSSDYTAIPCLLDYVISRTDLNGSDLIQDLKSFLMVTDENGNGMNYRTRSRVINALTEKISVTQPRIKIPEDMNRGVENIEWTLFGKTV